MDAKTILARAIQVVAVVFGAFGYFLRDIAPPAEVKAGFATGLGSMAALCLFLFISALAGGGRRVTHRTTWLRAAGALLALSLAASVTYAFMLDRLTFGWPPERPSVETHVRGFRYTVTAGAKAQKYNLKPADVVDGSGGLPRIESVWSAASLRKARLALLLNYLLVILGFTATIFCLTEGILVKQAVRARDAVPAGRD